METRWGSMDAVAAEQPEMEQLKWKEEQLLNTT